MRLETLEEALERLGQTKEMIRDKLLKLNALHQEAVALIGNADSSTVDGYYYDQLHRNGFHRVHYRGRCYPVKKGSSRYMSCLASANRLKEIEEEIKKIDGSYDPKNQCVYITKKLLEAEWIDEKGDNHALIGV